jgi:hypothetical protein
MSASDHGRLAAESLLLPRDLFLSESEFLELFVWPKPITVWIVFDYFVGSFFTIPATLRHPRTANFSLIAVASTTAEPLTASLRSTVRPAGVNITDASITVTIEEAIAALWYDPQTSFSMNWIFRGRE